MTDIRRRAWRSLIWGLVIAFVAGMISLATYADAQTQAAQTGQGSYYVLWGAIAFGLFKAGRAARVLLAIRRLR